MLGLAKPQRSPGIAGISVYFWGWSADIFPLGPIKLGLSGTAPQCTFHTRHSCCTETGRSPGPFEQQRGASIHGREQRHSTGAGGRGQITQTRRFKIPYVGGCKNSQVDVKKKGSMFLMCNLKNQVENWCVFPFFNVFSI